MSAVKAMRNTIAEKARAEAEEILSQAKRKAKAIIKRAREKGKKLQLQVAGPELRMIRSRTIGGAVAEGRGLRLKAKDEAISSVFEEARARIGEMASRGGRKYEKLLIDLMREAAVNIGDGGLVVSANERDKRFIKKNITPIQKELSKALGQKVRLSLAPGNLNCLGGIIMSSADGSRTYYNTLESRLLKLREKLAPKVGEMLFA
ncbi:MAG: V-type ATP synthase subunit E [Candidatus Bathyarchaeia archaeon]